MTVPTPAHDYERIAQAIAFIERNAQHQPSLDEIAASQHLSTYHFQRLFARWAGTTPKRYLQVLTVERAKSLLASGASALDASCDVGLSSSSRLHDHFVQLEAITPGQFKSGGANLVVRHAVHDTPFGAAFVASTDRGVCTLSFVDGPDATGELDELRRSWPNATFVEDPSATQSHVEAIFADATDASRPLTLQVRGTNFQVQVWRALLSIPPGALTSYAHVAQSIGHPSSARAVGQAVGANPVAFVIPCHRVIRQSGDLGGYRWGLTRKLAMHAWEEARTA